MRQPLLLEARGRGGWLQRAFLAVAAAGLVVVAFFFLTVALIAGAILAAVIALRWWWIMRKLKAQAKASGPLEGEYTVVEHERVDYRRENTQR